MRVLMTADAVGGVWTYAQELADALRARGVDVVLAVVGPAPRARRDGIHLIGGSLEWEDDPWHGVAHAGERLLELASELRPDVVHLNGYTHASLPWEAPVLVAGHSCVLSWWEAVRGEPAPARWDRYRRAVAAGLHAADAVIAPTAWMLGALRRLYGLRGGRVVHNGVSRGPPPSEKQPLVLAAGRLWDKAKGLPALADAAAGVDWPIAVAGEGATAAGVQLLGPLEREELRTWMGAAAIFAHPARYEPFGLAPLEAALAGCALVLGDIPPLREVWGDAAVFVRPGDPSALRAALRRLIADAGVRTELGERARSRALRYTAERMGEGYVRAYGNLRARDTAAA